MKCKVISHNLKLGGVKYALGDEIELTEAEAETLIRQECVEEVIKPFSKRATGARKTALHTANQES